MMSKIILQDWFETNYMHQRILNLFSPLFFTMFYYFYYSVNDFREKMLRTFIIGFFWSDIPDLLSCLLFVIEEDSYNFAIFILPYILFYFRFNKYLICFFAAYANNILILFLLCLPHIFKNFLQKCFPKAQHTTLVFDDSKNLICFYEANSLFFIQPNAKLINNVEHNIKEKSICSLCNENENRFKFSCGHQTCENCTLQWLKRSFTCAFCRKQF